MLTLQAYLQNPRTKRVLTRRPGDEGFSLIELVVVVAVLAIGGVMLIIVVSRDCMIALMT